MDYVFLNCLNLNLLSCIHIFKTALRHGVHEVRAELPGRMPSCPPRFSLVSTVLGTRPLAAAKSNSISTKRDGEARLLVCLALAG